MEWLGKAEDLDNVPDEYLKNSDEFPKLDIILATEIFKNAKAGCNELAILMRTLKESRMTSRKVAKGRELPIRPASG